MRHALRPSRSAFSLIEVLIAVVVLAFGLLGLAAVFPAVVKQQTSAKDSVQGVSALRSAEEWVLAHATLNEHQTIPTLASDLRRIENRRGWETLVADPAWNNDTDGGASGWPEAIVRASVLSSSRSGVLYDQDSGDMGIGRPVSATQRGVVIPISQRLFPTPYSDPKAKIEYVWDVAARRIDIGLPHVYNGDATQERTKWEDDGVLLAIFVRRIDPGIRLVAGSTRTPAEQLADALAGPMPTKIALAERTDGTPTLDGVPGRYAAPKRLDITFPDRTRLDVIEVADTSGQEPGLIAAAQQVGQVFVDVLGTVHRVQEVQTRNPLNSAPWARTRLIVEPPFDSKFRSMATPNVVFTTHIPAAVGVLRIDPRQGGRL